MEYKIYKLVLESWGLVESKDFASNEDAINYANILEADTGQVIRVEKSLQCGSEIIKGWDEQ